MWIAPSALLKVTHLFLNLEFHSRLLRELLSAMLVYQGKICTNGLIVFLFFEKALYAQSVTVPNEIWDQMIALDFDS
jgi:hypothetical protein